MTVTTRTVYLACLSVLLVLPAGAADESSTSVQQKIVNFRLGASQQDMANATAVVPNSSPTPRAEKQGSWFDHVFDQKLPVTFGINVAEIYSDNIFYQPHGTDDYITRISPFISFQLGRPIANLTPSLDQETKDIKSDAGNLNFLKIDYHPTFNLYAKNSHLDVVDEYANAQYAHQFGKLTLSLEQNYQKLSQPTIEDTAVGELVHRDIYQTNFLASYIYSDKLSTYGSIHQIISDYQSHLYTSSNEWNGEYYFLYQLLPKLSIGAGPKIGYIDIDRAENQAYQQALIHLFYPATGKLSFSAAFGGEVREYTGSGPTRVTPILDAAASYRPFDSMTISLSASRHDIVSNSQVGQNYTASNVTLSVRQRLVQVVYFTLTGGYQNDSYTGGGTSTGPKREDDFFFVSTGLEWNSKDLFVVDASYQYSRDDSTAQIFSFDENRFTVSGTVKY